MSKAEDQFKSTLQENGMRVTQSRMTVFAILEKYKEQFLSTDEIFEKIKKSKGPQCDRASVYRILNSLEEIGLVNVSHFQGEANKYQLHLHTEHCNHSEDEHQHYFKCTKCKSVEPIGDCLFDAKVNELTKKGFLCQSHHFEVIGLCPSCH